MCGDHWNMADTKKTFVDVHNLSNFPPYIVLESGIKFGNKIELQQYRLLRIVFCVKIDSKFIRKVDVDMVNGVTTLCQIRPQCRVEKVTNFVYPHCLFHRNIWREKRYFSLFISCKKTVNFQHLLRITEVLNPRKYFWMKFKLVAFYTLNLNYQ